MSNPIERGMAAARATERARVRSVLDAVLIDVRRTSISKGVNQPARDAYDRAYDRLQQAAQAWANLTEEDTEIPVRDAPPALPEVLHEWARQVAAVLAKHKITIANLPLPQTTQVIGPKAPDGSYRETRGMGPSGRGGPAPGFPGTDANEAWLNVQGAK